MSESKAYGNPPANVTALLSVAPSPGAALSLARDVTLIGSGADVRLRLRSAAVARCHVAVLNVDGGLYLRDLSSRSNVYVNEQLTREGTLHGDDRLQVGPFVFSVWQGIPPSEPAIPTAGDALLRGADDAKNHILGRTLLIGRTTNCDLRIAGAEVSSAHALIFALGGGHQIRDLNTRTGTRVNGQPIRQVALAPGDVIEIGQYQLRYLLGAQRPQQGNDISSEKQTAEPVADPLAAGGMNAVPLPFQRVGAIEPPTCEKLAATISFQGLESVFDGRPCHVTAVTDPPGLPGVMLTYNGSADAPINAGRYRVVAELEHPSFAAPSATAALVIRRARQSISIAPIPPCAHGDAPISLSAAASSGLPVHFTAAGALRVMGNKATIVSSGTAHVTATQSGGTNYEPASETLTVVVSPAPLEQAIKHLEPASGLPPVPQFGPIAAHRIDPTAFAPNVIGNLSTHDNPIAVSLATDTAYPIAWTPTQAAARWPVDPMNEEHSADTAREHREEPSAPAASLAVEPLHGDSMLQLLPAVFGMGSFEEEMQTLQAAGQPVKGTDGSAAATGVLQNKRPPAGKEPSRGWVGQLVNRVKR